MISDYYTKLYCCEPACKIAGYDDACADKSQTWICHHILGESMSREMLESKNLYYHRPAAEFRFVSPKEHIAIHNTQTRRSIAGNRAQSYESRVRRCKANHEKLTSEVKQRLQKIRSSAGGSLPWWNNGIKNTRATVSPGPEWKSGMLKK